MSRDNPFNQNPSQEDDDIFFDALDKEEYEVLERQRRASTTISSMPYSPTVNYNIAGFDQIHSIRASDGIGEYFSLEINVPSGGSRRCFFNSQEIIAGAAPLVFQTRQGDFIAQRVGNIISLVGEDLWIEVEDGSQTIVDMFDRITSTGLQLTPSGDILNQTTIAFQQPPFNTPTAAPTNQPTTANPTSRAPTGLPTTANPTGAPSRSPVASPTHAPSRAPIASPTHAPSRAPTTANPTELPTGAPSRSPVATPTDSPTRPGETRGPTTPPTGVPSSLSPTSRAPISRAPITGAPFSLSPSSTPTAAIGGGGGEGGNGATIGAAVGVTALATIIGGVLYWRHRSKEANKERPRRVHGDIPQHHNADMFHNPLSDPNAYDAVGGRDDYLAVSTAVSTVEDPDEALAAARDERTNTGTRDTLRRRSPATVPGADPQYSDPQAFRTTAGARRTSVGHYVSSTSPYLDQPAGGFAADAGNPGGYATVVPGAAGAGKSDKGVIYESGPAAAGAAQGGNPTDAYAVPHAARRGATGEEERYVAVDLPPAGAGVRGADDDGETQYAGVTLPSGIVVPPPQRARRNAAAATATDEPVYADQPQLATAGAGVRGADDDGEIQYAGVTLPGGIVVPPPTVARGQGGTRQLQRGGRGGGMVRGSDSPRDTGGERFGGFGALGASDT